MVQLYIDVLFTEWYIAKSVINNNVPFITNCIVLLQEQIKSNLNQSLSHTQQHIHTNHSQFTFSKYTLYKPLLH